MSPKSSCGKLYRTFLNRSRSSLFYGARNWWPPVPYMSVDNQSINGKFEFHGDDPKIYEPHTFAILMGPNLISLKNSFMVPHH
ncbi:hypothetical protein TNCV_1415461 [Trichonephila clavipes]|nr:hypothetical protein TNCV_1415461 [Trichonephila clavipes]